MKKIKFILTFICCLFCIFANADASYKGVTLYRDIYDNTKFVIRNDNSSSVKIRMQYKVGSKTADWQEYYIDYAIPGNTTTSPISVGSKIYALKLTYVHVNIEEAIREGIDGFVEGWNKAKEQQQNNQ